MLSNQTRKREGSAKFPPAFMYNAQLSTRVACSCKLLHSLPLLHRFCLSSATARKLSRARRSYTCFTATKHLPASSSIRVKPSTAVTEAKKVKRTKLLRASCTFFKPPTHPCARTHLRTFTVDRPRNAVEVCEAARAADASEADRAHRFSQHHCSPRLR